MIRINDPMVRSTALKYILRHRSGFTLAELSEQLSCSESEAEKVIYVLKNDDGINLHPGAGCWFVLSELPRCKPYTIKPDRVIKLGIISDVHMVSKFCREDVLVTAMECFKDVDKIIIPGNLIDGEFRYNKYELHTIGLHNQCRYVAEHFPNIGKEILFLTGDCHEGWYTKDTGVNIGWYMENAINRLGNRGDFKHIGHGEQDILIGKTKIKITHPGGGSAYAMSYSSQKIVESFQGGEKPAVMLVGHYHKFDYCYPREVHVIQCGCCQDQTPFMRKHKLAAHVGFIILTLKLYEDGTISSVIPEWFPFYDRKYYADKPIAEI